MEASKELVSDLLINPEGAAVQKFDLEELVPVLEKCKYMSSPSIKNDVTAFKFIQRFGVMMASPRLEAVATGPTCRRTSSRDRALTQTKFLFSRCPKWGLDSGFTWSNECNLEEI